MHREVSALRKAPVAFLSGAQPDPPGKQTGRFKLSGLFAVAVTSALLPEAQELRGRLLTPPFVLIQTTIGERLQARA
ncbi:hypothetical protein GCM10008955_25950 [Deinococcus malanensis]|uniref:Uncharacterized protein n=1 Tax=Deinococcus malanensis TaxID=1706855 RepID=A0ABQ2F0E9_9DEIO|nr:hypothetical protein GCM10008955_25950 [Deinococcus malanensis]